MSNFCWLSLTIFCSKIGQSRLSADGKLDLKRIASVINSVSPDFVALQEVDNQTGRTGKVDQANVLSELTGLYSAYSKALDFQGGVYGNAFLSRHPLTKSTVHRLPNMEGHEQRVLLETEITLPHHGHKQSITFITTHVDHVANSPDRPAAIPVIEALAKQMSHPVFLAGDMNAAPESAEMTELMKTFTPANQDASLLTSPAEHPRRQIDYIFYYPSTRWKTKQVEVLDEAVASDHRALFAVLELQVND